MNVYDTPISISVAPSNSFVDFYPKTIAFKEMAVLVHTPLKYCATTFRDNRRKASNFSGKSNIIILDFDEGFPDEYWDIFDKYVGIIAPTKSHMKDKHGLICPRYRVILLLKTPMITNYYRHKQIYKHIIKDLGVKADGACVDASRFYYGSPENKHLTRFLKGTELFDWTKYDYEDFRYVDFKAPVDIDITPYKHLDLSYLDTLNQSKRYECPICAMNGDDPRKHHLGFEKERKIVTCFYDDEHSIILRKLYYNKNKEQMEEEANMGKERCQISDIPVATRYPHPTNYADDTLAKYDAALSVLEKSPVIFLDTETFSEKRVVISLEEAKELLKDKGYVKTAYNHALEQFDGVALDPLMNRIRLIQLGNGQINVPFDLYYARPDQITRILNIIKNSFIVGQNLKFDFSSIMNKFGEQWLPKYCFDTFIASKLIHQALDYELDPLGHNLGAIAFRYLGIHMKKDQGGSDWGVDNLSHDQIRYSIEDISVLPAIYAKMLEKFKEVYGPFEWTHHDKEQLRFLGPLLDIHPVLAIEMQFVLELARIETVGVPVDKELLTKVRAKNMAEMEDIEKYLGINAKSSPQCVAFLQKYVDPTITSSNKETLKAYAGNPYADKMSRGKALSTRTGLINSMLDTHPFDDRLHTSFTQILSTGRMASKGPNMQQIPRTIKDYIYKSRPGYIISDADYPAVELRIEAVVTEDPVMIEAYREKQDLHYKTAYGIFKKPIPHTPEEKAAAEHGGNFISKEERGKGKTANFGLIYGMIAETLQDYYKQSGVTISLDEATKIRNAFMDLYPNVAKTIEATYSEFMRGKEVEKEILTKEGSFKRKVPYFTYIRTLMGRRTAVESPNKKLNYPVQGTGADIAKIAVCWIMYHIRQAGLDMHIINMIHDDIVYEAAVKDYEQSKKIFVDGMSFAVNYVLKHFFETDMNDEFTDLSIEGKAVKEYEG